MVISDVASVRTGLVTARKKASDEEKGCSEKYQCINLKCIADAGFLELENIEEYYSKEHLTKEYLTQKGDILIRLSTPYSSVMITKEEECGLVIPSHFAVIRVNRGKASPEYIFWALRRDSTKQKILKNNSGSTSFGTISSGFFANLQVRDIPLDKQAIVGELLLLSEREQELLYKLANEKKRYNKAIVNQIYNSFKRGNEDDN